LKRIKRRYLALQIESISSLLPRAIIDAIWGSVAKLYGEYGASQTNLSLIDYDSENQIAIIRTNLSSLNLVRSSLVTIILIEGNPVSFHVLAISGTIKSLKKNILK
jgi:RNase P/RNase MRP subunit POP5